MQVPLLVWNIRCTFRLEKLCDILFTTRLHNTIVRQANQGESGGLPATPPRWSGFRLCFIPNPAFRRVAAPRWAMILSPLRAQVSARRWLAKVNCEFEKSAQMSHLCRFHPFGVKTCWGGCLPPLSPPTTERASRSLLWIPLCGTAFD